MSDYRRLISYIYAYEGGIKGKNIGFAKLEARKGQCKIQVSVRNVYGGGQDMGVYMLAAKGEIMLGKMFLRGGAGEFRTAVLPGNVAGSGQGLEQCYGLTIHGVEDAWRSYTTIWEDAVAHAAEVDLEETTAEKAEEREMEAIPSSEIQEKTLVEMEERPQISAVDAIEAEIQAQESMNRNKTGILKDAPGEGTAVKTVEPMKFIQEIANRKAASWQRSDSQRQQSPLKTSSGVPAEQTLPIVAGECYSESAGVLPGASASAREMGAGERSRNMPAGAPDLAGERYAGSKNTAAEMSASMSERDSGSGGALPEGSGLTCEWHSGSGSSLPGASGKAGEQYSESRSVSPGASNSAGEQYPGNGSISSGASPSPGEQLFGTACLPPGVSTGSGEQPSAVASIPPGDSPHAGSLPGSQPSAEEPVSSAPLGQQADYLTHLEQEETEGQDDALKLWQYFQRHYPKIRAFDYSGGCEILIIKPQDIGLLPRETWGYGNNSFLLHGYYNHRYLILARLIGQKGELRFLLGVPGHYYSNEKYMASMFGFPNFVLSKMQPAGDGRFGYWYTDIRLGP